MMGRKGKEITFEQKSSILALLNSGTSKAEISRLLSLIPLQFTNFVKDFQSDSAKKTSKDLP